MKSEEPADEMLILRCTENSCSEISPSFPSEHMNGL